MTKLQKPQIPALTKLDGYEPFLQGLKERVRSAQLKAAVSVNTELIALYWELGRSIVEQQKKSGWGDAVLEHLSNDLTSAFPDLKGFSRRNLYRIRGLYLAYQAESEFVPQPVAQIPWGHNIVILEKVKDPIERNWYTVQTMRPAAQSRAQIQNPIQPSKIDLT
jgi:predicted nuclease of restriction endonuclease-like (RecB) superfamily